jgi:hypothetical protein
MEVGKVHMSAAEKLERKEDAIRAKEEKSGKIL